jgi:lysophospholipase L1-like esterase
LAKESNCQNTDNGGGFLEDYVNLELEIARQYGVEVLDNFHESGIGSTGDFEEWEIYTQDGLHLNEKGRRLVAERIVEIIKGVR